MHFHMIFCLFRIAEIQVSRSSVLSIAKCFAPLIIGYSRLLGDDGLKKLQDIKEQQMV